VTKTGGHPARSLRYRAVFSKKGSFLAGFPPGCSGLCVCRLRLRSPASPSGLPPVHDPRPVLFRLPVVLQGSVAQFWIRGLRLHPLTPFFVNEDMICHELNGFWRDCGTFSGLGSVPQSTRAPCGCPERGSLQVGQHLGREEGDTHAVRATCYQFPPVPSSSLHT
jgi:hypothetical protein